MGIVPKLKTINPLDLLPRYVWVDEDGEQVSPIHESMRAAINFINGWHPRWGKLVERWGEPDDDDKFRKHYAYAPMTKSGKPPTDLKRVHVQISVVDIDTEERAIVDAMLKRDLPKEEL